MPTAAVRSVSAVGVVGCGRMGRAIAGHLLRHGVDTVAADPDPAALDQVVAAGARPYPDAKSLAGAADLVLVVVVDDDQVREVVAGGSGLLAGIRPGSVIAVCASVRPDTCRALASEASRSAIGLPMLPRPMKPTRVTGGRPARRRRP